MTVLSCGARNDSVLLTGDLYFGVLRIGSYYNQTDSVIQSWEAYFDSTNFELKDQNEQFLGRYYHNIKDKDLLYKPFVDLLIAEDSIIRLYLEITDYNKVKIYKRKTLRDQGKKVRFETLVQPIDTALYYCLELRKVDVVEGQTLQRQSKFKIEDYN